MGRGRAKAKQTKVARQLKYSTGGLDAERLQAELARGGGHPDHDGEAPGQAVEDEDPYAAYVKDDADEHESA